MTRLVDAAGEQLQGLRQQMQQLGRKVSPAGGGDGSAGRLAGLSYGAIMAEVAPLIGPAIEGLLSRFRSVPAPEPAPVRVVVAPRKRVFTISRVAGAGAVVVLGALAYGLGSGKLRINVQGRRIAP